MSFFKRKGEEAPVALPVATSTVASIKHATLHYIAALDKMFKAAATLPMTPRCFQNLVFLSPLVTAVNPASLAVASIFWLLNRVYGEPGGPMKHAKCILNIVSGYKKSNLSIS